MEGPEAGILEDIQLASKSTKSPGYTMVGGKEKTKKTNPKTKSLTDNMFLSEYQREVSFKLNSAPGDAIDTY